MAAIKERLNEEQFMRLPDEGQKLELVDGEAIEVPTGGIHEEIVVRLILLLSGIAMKLGKLYGSNLGCRMTSADVRVPDVAFIRKERLPEGRSPRGFFEGAPDICIEVISPSEDKREMFRKVGEYFDSGAQEVWQVFPDSRRVLVYSLTEDVRAYEAGDELTAAELLPGFRCKVSEIFDVE